MKIGIIKEGKTPPDKRVPFTPAQAKEAREKFNLDLVVQPSAIRAFKDEEYAELGIPMQDDLSDCDVLMGVKEVPIDMLINNKQYFFFSHTIKKQPYNQKLIKAFLEKKITMTDYETLTYKTGARILGFGRYAGLVGAYNGLIAYGNRTGLFNLKPANQCEDLEEMKRELANIQLPAIKIALTGGGRVANGAIEILKELNVREVSPEEYKNGQFNEAVYVQLNSGEMYEHKDGEAFVTKDFYKNPKNYVCTFKQYIPGTELFISCHYWDHNADVLWRAEDMLSPDFDIKVIADITCDIKGSIPSTIRPSTIADPIYGFDPKTGEETDSYNENGITVMAVDNLPCEIPKDASEGFGRALIDHVLPCLLGDDEDEVIKRASITINGELGPNYDYLHDYAYGELV